MSEGMLEHDWFPEPLPGNVEIGEGTWLHSSYSLLHYRSERACGLRIGRHSGIYIDTFFDLGPGGEVEIGAYCTIAGPIFSTNGRIAIGDYGIISREVLLADSPATVPHEPRHEASSPEDIILGENVWIGTRAVLLPGARIGDGAIVGANTVVDFEVPPHAVIAGNPARISGWAHPEDRSP